MNFRIKLLIRVHNKQNKNCYILLIGVWNRLIWLFLMICVNEKLDEA